MRGQLVRVLGRYRLPLIGLVLLLAVIGLRVATVQAITYPPVTLVPGAQFAVLGNVCTPTSTVVGQALVLTCTAPGANSGTAPGAVPIFLNAGDQVQVNGNGCVPSAATVGNGLILTCSVGAPTFTPTAVASDLNLLSTDTVNIGCAQNAAPYNSLIYPTALAIQILCPVASPTPRSGATATPTPVRSGTNVPPLSLGTGVDVHCPSGYMPITGVVTSDNIVVTCGFLTVTLTPTPVPRTAFRLYMHVRATPWADLQPYVRAGDLYWDQVDNSVIPQPVNAFTFGRYSDLTSHADSYYASYTAINLDAELNDFALQLSEVAQIRSWVDTYNAAHPSLPLSYAAFFPLHLIDNQPMVVTYPDVVLVGKSEWAGAQIITNAQPYIDQIVAAGKTPGVVLGATYQIRVNGTPVTIQYTNAEVLANFHEVIDLPPSGLGLDIVSYVYPQSNDVSLINALSILRAGPTFTPTTTPTGTATFTATATPTITATPTSTPQTPTDTPTQTPTFTSTATPTATWTGSPTPTATSSIAAGTTWNQDGANAQRTGSFAEEPTQPWTFAWNFNGADTSGTAANHTYDVALFPQAHIVAGGGNVYAPAGAAGVYAISEMSVGHLNPATGALWRFNPASVTFPASGVYDPTTGYFLIGGSNGLLYELNAQTGALIGSFNVSSPISYPLLLVGNFVYAVSDNGVLHKVAISGLSQAWTYTGGGPATAGLAYSISRDAIIYCTANAAKSACQAVNNSNGTQKWIASPQPNGAPTSYFGYLYNQFTGWPTIAESHGVVFVWYELLDHYEQLMGQAPIPTPVGCSGCFPAGNVLTTSATTRAWVTANPQLRHLFALSLDTGAAAFTPIDGINAAEIQPTHYNGQSEHTFGAMPVIKVWPNGEEVAYQAFRNGSCTSVGNEKDYRTDSQLGEMEMDSTIVAGLVAGDFRFLDNNGNCLTGTRGDGKSYISDERGPFTLLGSTLIVNHWNTMEAYTILDRSASKGLTYNNGITLTRQPVVLGSVDGTASCGTAWNATTHQVTTNNCDHAQWYNENRNFLSPAFYEYFNVADPPLLNATGSSGQDGGPVGYDPQYTIESDGFVFWQDSGGGIVAFQHASATNTITSVVRNTTSPTKYGQVNFTVAMSASPANPYYSFDPQDDVAANPGSMTWVGRQGMSVDLHLVAPSALVITQPCFWNVTQNITSNSGSEVLGNTEAGHWECRVAPAETGTYTYYTTAQDASGTARLPASGTSSFVVSTSSAKGPIKVSATDARYLTYSTGASYVPIAAGHQLWGNQALKSYDFTAFLTNAQTYGINLFRLWTNQNSPTFLSVEGTEVNDWFDCSTSFGTLKGFEVGALGDINVHSGYRAIAPQVGKDACQRLNLTTPSGTYQFSAWVKTAGMTDGAPLIKVYDGVGFGASSQLCTLGTLAGGTQDWTQYVVTCTPGSGKNLVTIHIGRTAGTAGTFYVDDLTLGPSSGGVLTYNAMLNPGFERYFCTGNCGANNDPAASPGNNRPVGTWINQESAAELDAIVTSAETNGVAIQICPCGGPVGTWPIDNNAMAESTINQHWFLASWKRHFRYNIARWGYSPAVLGWELHNEMGNISLSATPNAWAFIKAIEDYIAATDPYHHLITNSQGSGITGASMWSLAQMTAANLHNYMMAGLYNPATYPNFERDESNFVYWQAWCVQHQTSPAWQSSFCQVNGHTILWDGTTWTGGPKPWIWGEIGVGDQVDTAFNVAYAPATTGTGGLIALHNELWAGLFSPMATDPIDWYWQNQTGSYTSVPPTGDFITEFQEKHWASLFFSSLGVPYSTASWIYQMTAADAPTGYAGTTVGSTDANARVYAMRSADATKAIAWVQNRNNTWYQWTQTGLAPTAITPTITVHNLTVSHTFSVVIYNTHTGATISTTSIASNGSGDLSFAVSSLTDDVAVSIQ